MIRIPDGRNLAGPILVRRRRRRADPGPSSSEVAPDLTREAPGGEEDQPPTRPGRKPPRSHRQRARDAAPDPELKLIVGVSRKCGLPGFGSLGASCGLEITLDAGAFDAPTFEARARQAFDRCAHAVDDQLDRARAPAREAGPTPVDHPPPEPRTRPCTVAQLRALHALARRLDLDLDALALRRFDAPSPEALSLVQASRLITDLQPPAPDDAP